MEKDTFAIRKGKQLQSGKEPYKSDWAKIQLQ